MHILDQTREFQCSSASRKFLNETEVRVVGGAISVSVLFSEPKIPQSDLHRRAERTRRCFSALQRAENSSIPLLRSYISRPSRVFQCSSASRKFLNSHLPFGIHCRQHRFQCSSASRKFLNISRPGNAEISIAMFQCSSASRKFLNRPNVRDDAAGAVSFSALQRAENSSIAHRRRFSESGVGWFQCSSASRKFLNDYSPVPALSDAAFQCSSASRKFLNRRGSSRTPHPTRFQCSSASRKFLN